MEQSKNIKAIDEQIKRKQDKIFRLKDESDRLTAEISDLLKKKKLLQTDELVKEMGRSKKSYEEIIEFIREGSDEIETNDSVPKRRGRRRKKEQNSD